MFVNEAICCMISFIRGSDIAAPNCSLDSIQKFAIQIKLAAGAPGVVNPLRISYFTQLSPRISTYFGINVFEYISKSKFDPSLLG